MTTALKNSAQVMFDNLVMAFDDDITVETATRLAYELGVNFDVRDYEH